MAEGVGYDVDGPPRCVFCIRDVSKISRIACEECSAVLCIKCYQLGPEAGAHKRGHNYQISSDTTDALFDPRFSKQDEQELIQIVHRYKLGNWDAVTQQLPKGKKRNPIEVARHFHLYFVLSTLGRTAMKEKEWIERREHFKHDIGQILGDPSGQELYYHAAMEALRACKDLPSTGDDYVIEKIERIVQAHFDAVSRSERKRKAISMDLGLYKAKALQDKPKECFPYGESDDDEWWESMYTAGSIEKKERDRYYEDQFVCGDENCMALTAEDVDVEPPELDQMIQELQDQKFEDPEALEILESLKELKLDEEEENELMNGKKKEKEDTEVQKKTDQSEEKKEETKEEDEQHIVVKRARIECPDRLDDRPIHLFVPTQHHIGTVVDIDEELQEELEGAPDVFPAILEEPFGSVASDSEASSVEDAEDASDNDSSTSSESESEAGSDSSTSDSDVAGVFDYAAYEAAMREAGYASDDLYSDWDEETSGRLVEQLKELAKTGQLGADSTEEEGEEDEEEEEEEDEEEEEEEEEEKVDRMAPRVVAGPSGLQRQRMENLVLPPPLAETSEDDEEEDEEEGEELKEEDEDADESDISSQENSEESEASEDSEEDEDSEGSDLSEGTESDSASETSEESATQTESEEEMLDRLFGTPLNHPREPKQSKKLMKEQQMTHWEIKCYELGDDDEYHTVDDENDVPVLEGTVEYGDSDEEYYEEEPLEDEEEEFYDDHQEEEYGDEELGEEQELPFDEQEEEEEVYHEASADDYEERLQLMQLREYAHATDEMEEDHGERKDGKDDEEQAPVESGDQPGEVEIKEEVDLDKTPEARFGDEYESAEETNEDQQVNEGERPASGEVIQFLFDQDGGAEIHQRQKRRQRGEEEGDEEYEGGLYTPEDDPEEEQLEDEQPAEYEDECEDVEQDQMYSDRAHPSDLPVRRCPADVPCPDDCHCELANDDDRLFAIYAEQELVIPCGVPVPIVEESLASPEEVLDEASLYRDDDEEEEYRDASEQPFDREEEGEQREEEERVETEVIPREPTPGDEYLEEDEEEVNKEGEEDEKMEVDEEEAPAQPMQPLCVDTGEESDVDVESVDEEDESVPPSDSAQISPEDDDDDTALYKLAEDASIEDDGDEEEEEDEEQPEVPEAVEEEVVVGEDVTAEPVHEERRHGERRAECTCADCTGRDEEEVECDCVDCVREEMMRGRWHEARENADEDDEDLDMDCACPECCAARKEKEEAEEEGEEEEISEEEREMVDEEEEEDFIDTEQREEDELNASDSDDPYYDNYDGPEEVCVDILEETDTYIKIAPLVVRLHDDETPPVERLHDGDFDQEDDEEHPAVPLYVKMAAAEAAMAAAAAARPVAAEEQPEDEFLDALDSQEPDNDDEEDTMDSTTVGHQLEEDSQDAPEAKEETPEPSTSKVKSYNDDDLCGLEEEKEEDDEDETAEDRDKTPPMLQSPDSKSEEALKTPIMVIKKVHARGRTNLRVETRPRTPQNPPPAEEKKEEKEGEDAGEEPVPPPKKPKKMSKEFQALFKDVEMREWEEKTANTLKERAEQRLGTGCERSSRFVIAVSDSEPEDEKSKKAREQKPTCSKNIVEEEPLTRSSRRAKSAAPKEKRKGSTSPKKKGKKNEKKTKKGKKRAAEVESEKESSGEEEEEKDDKGPQKKRARRKPKISSSKKERRAKWNKKIENRKARQEAKVEEHRKQVVVSSVEYFEQHDITYFSNVFRRIPFDYEDHGFRNRVNFKNCFVDLYNMGYSRERDDLEVEYYNEAESMISRLNINNSDGTMPHDLENEIKLAKVERYMRVLQERRAMRNHAAEYETIPDFLQLCKKMNNERRKLKDVLRSKPLEERFETRLTTVLPRDELLEMKQAKQRLLKMRVRAEKLKELHDAGETRLDGHEHLTRVFARSKFGPSDGHKKVPLPERQKMLRADERIVSQLGRMRLLSDASSDEEGATSPMGLQTIQ